MDKFEQHIKRMKGLRGVYEAGTGQHNILSILIEECEAALRQPLVSGLDLGEELLEQHKIRLDIEDGHHLPKWAVNKIERWQSNR